MNTLASPAAYGELIAPATLRLQRLVRERTIEKLGDTA